MKGMGCTLSRGSACPFIDAAFEELSIGLSVPGCPWAYSPQKTIEEKCSLYIAAKNASDYFWEEAQDA